MKIEQRTVADVTVLKPTGPLITVDAAQFKGSLMDAASEPGRKLVVDATAVAYVDSRGLEVLVDFSRSLSQRQGRLKLAGANETVREVLELTEAAELFEYFDGVEAAAESFGVAAGAS